jgi:hypothetical protein
MHVATLTWSEMTVTQHAAATKLPKSCLRRWRDPIDHGEFEIERRAQVYTDHICEKSQRHPQLSRRDDLRTIARDRVRPRPRFGQPRVPFLRKTRVRIRRFSR